MAADFAVVVGPGRDAAGEHAGVDEVEVGQGIRPVEVRVVDFEADVEGDGGGLDWGEVDAGDFG